MHELPIATWEAFQTNHEMGGDGKGGIRVAFMVNGVLSHGWLGEKVAGGLFEVLIPAAGSEVSVVRRTDEIWPADLAAAIECRDSGMYLSTENLASKCMQNHELLNA